MSKKDIKENKHSGWRFFFFTTQPLLWFHFYKHSLHRKERPETSTLQLVSLSRPWARFQSSRLWPANTPWRMELFFTASERNCFSLGSLNLTEKRANDRSCKVWLVPCGFRRAVWVWAALALKCRHFPVSGGRNSRTHCANWLCLTIGLAYVNRGSRVSRSSQVSDPLPYNHFLRNS